MLVSKPNLFILIVLQYTRIEYFSFLKMDKYNIFSSRPNRRKQSTNDLTLPAKRNHFMSVPPLFKFSKNSFFSIGLPGVENIFYQLSEDELKKQMASSKKNKKETENTLPPLFVMKDNKSEIFFNSHESFNILDEKHFDGLYQKMIAHLENKQIWIRDSYWVLSNKNTFKTRHISEDPKVDLFVLKNFTMPAKKELENFEPEWFLINTPDFFANPKDNGINDTKFSVINFVKKVVLIGGASYSEKLIKGLLADIDFGS